MTDRLSRSNSQSDLPNYGQGQPDDKKKDVDKKKDGATGQSDKNTGQDHEDKNKAPPQMKSKEGKKVKASSESDSDGAGAGYGNNFEKILFSRKQDEVASSNTSQEVFLGAKPSSTEQKFKKENESSSEYHDVSHDHKMQQSHKQQQFENKEKYNSKKVTGLSLEGIGNAFKSLASDRPEMTISSRKKEKNAQRATQDSNASPGQTAVSKAPIIANATNLPKTFTRTTTPGRPPASQRLESSYTNSSNVTVSGTSIVANTKTTATNIKNRSTVVTDKDLLDQNKVKGKEPENEKSATSGAIKASMLTPEARLALYSALEGEIISGDQLAELLLCVESNGYTKPLTSASVDSILRGALTVGELPALSYSGEEIKVNVITTASMPFIQKYFAKNDTKEYIKKLASQYKKIARSFTQEMKESTAKNLRKNEKFTELMRPLVDSFLERFVGREMKKSSSPLPIEVKNLLLGIDARVIRWAKKMGVVKPNLLFEARKSALAAYVCTRSLTPILRTQLTADPEFDSERLDILSSYLNTLLTNQLDNFYFDIMSSIKNQDPDQEKLLISHKKAAALVQETKAKNRMKSVEKEKIESERGSISPNSPREKIKSPTEKILDRNSMANQNARSNRRYAELSQFIKSAKIIPDSDFLGSFREKLREFTPEEYSKFKTNPANYMLEYWADYISGNPGKFQFDGALLKGMKDRLVHLADIENETTLAEKNARPASALQAKTNIPTQTLKTQVISSTSVLELQKRTTEMITERNSTDSLASSKEEAEDVLQGANTIFPFENHLNQLQTTEVAVQQSLTNSLMSSNKPELEKLRKSPFEDSDDSSSATEGESIRKTMTDEETPQKEAIDL